MLIKTLRLWRGSLQKNGKTICCDFFVFISLLLGSGVFSHILSPEYLREGGRLQISLLARVPLALSYMIAGGLLCFRWRGLLTRISIVGYLWGVVLLFSVLSVAWGQSDLFAVVRLLGFIGCFLIGIMVFACTQNFRRVVELVFLVCSCILLVNVCYLLFYSSLDIANPNIKGLFGQKNPMGHFAVLTIFVSSFMIAGWNRFYRWMAIAVFILACWLLFLSKSMTSNFLIPIACIASGAALVVRRFRLGWLGVVVFIGLSALGLFFYWSELFATVGKSTDFTNRTSIWMEYWQLIEQKMFFGHGYGAYPNKPNWLISLGTHSGYFEVLYYWGIAGLGMIVSILFFAGKGWWLDLRRSGSLLELCFCGSFLAIFLALNITETYMLSRSGLFWPLFIYCTLQLDFLSNSSATN